MPITALIGSKTLSGRMFGAAYPAKNDSVYRRSGLPPIAHLLFIRCTGYTFRLR